MNTEITLKEYLGMGGKIENLLVARNTYHNEIGKISFSHKNPPSFGNPNGVMIYNVGDKKIAEDWIKVNVTLKLDSQYTD